MDDWLTIALAIGLTARLTRLVSMDTITAPIRDRLPGLLGALAQCAWCSGVWVAVPVGLSWHWWGAHTWWQVIALIGTAAWAAGAASNAAMPRQHEVMTVGPVALVNADEPDPEPEARPDQRVTIALDADSPGDTRSADLASAIEDHDGSAEADQQVETALRRYLGARPHPKGDA